MAKLKLEDGTEVEAFTADEVAARIAEETNGLKAKVDELLGESKSAKQKARELEEMQKKAEEDGLKQKEEFRTLYEREQKSAAELREKLEAQSKRIETKELESASTKLTSELTRDTKRAELLKKEIMAFARYSEDGVFFEMGGVKVDSAKILAHITDNYPFLVDGSGATGGGAAGANKSGGAVKKFNEYTGAELKAIKDKDPGEYERLRSEHYGK